MDWPSSRVRQLREMTGSLMHFNQDVKERLPIREGQEARYTKRGDG
jgi:hypothetical protein